MKNKLISLLLLACFCFACESESNDGVVVAIQIGLTLEDQEGNDLLNPVNENSLAQKNIKVFYEIEGERETYVSINENAILDNPAGFLIYPPEGSGMYHLNIFSNPTKGEAITIIELEGHDDVTLTTEVSQRNGNTIVEKIWYKDNLVWPTDSNNGPAYVRVVLE